jgi:hypothetical protein
MGKKWECVIERKVVIFFTDRDAGPEDCEKIAREVIGASLPEGRMLGVGGFRVTGSTARVISCREATERTPSLLNVSASPLRQQGFGRENIRQDKTDMSYELF